MAIPVLFAFVTHYHNEGGLAFVLVEGERVQRFRVRKALEHLGRNEPAWASDLLVSPVPAKVIPFLSTNHVAPLTSAT